MMFLGYFFVNEFFNKASRLDFNKLVRLNSALVDYEYGVKSGRIDDEIGLKNLILKI